MISHHHAAFRVTPAAAAELCRQAARTPRPGAATLELQAGGCEAWAVSIRAGTADGEPIARADGITLFATRDAAGQLAGMSLDHHCDLRGAGFVFSGPADMQMCSCGTSFSRRPSCRIGNRFTR